MKSIFAALVFLSLSSAYALDARETLSNFQIDGDVQESPSQLLITNAHITYTSSKSGAASVPLRLNVETPRVGALAVCLSFGASKLVELDGGADTGTDRVLIVELSKNQPVFNWAHGYDSFVVGEVLCER